MGVAQTCYRMGNQLRFVICMYNRKLNALLTRVLQIQPVVTLPRRQFFFLSFKYN